MSINSTAQLKLDTRMRMSSRDSTYFLSTLVSWLRVHERVSGR